MIPQENLRQGPVNWLRLLACALILALAPVPAKASTDERVQIALNALDKRQFNKAQGDFMHGLKEAQKNGDTVAEGRYHFYLGLVLQQRIENEGASHPDKVAGWLQEAQSHYELAAKMLPNSGGVWNNLAQVYAKKGDTKKADETFQKAISIADDRQPLYTVNYADFLSESGRRQDAARFYNLALQSQPTNERAFKALIDYFRVEDIDQAVALLRRQLEQGQILQVLDTAVSILNSDTRRLRRQQGEELLTVVVMCLARLCDQPQDFLDTPAAEQLRKLTRGDYAQPVGEIFSLYEDDFKDRRYEWWPKQTKWDGMISPGKSRLDAFNTLIRALGDRARRRNRIDEAEAYYMLAFRMDPTNPDGKALVKVADLYVQTNRQPKVNELLRYEQSLYSAKGSAYRKMDSQDIYEYHRALGIIYTHLNRLGGANHVDSAVFQLDRALQASIEYNKKAIREPDLKPIIEPELVNVLAEMHAKTGQTQKAFELRVKMAHHYRQLGTLDAATYVFRPIAATAPPPNLNSDTSKQYNTLKKDFGRTGFKTGHAPEPSLLHRVIPILPSPSPKILVSETRTAFGLLKLTQPPDQPLSQTKIASLSDMVDLLIQQSQRRKVDQNRYTFLPNNLPTDVVKVDFDGRQGKIFVGRKSKIVEVSFTVETTAKSRLRAFQAIRPLRKRK